MSSLFKILFLIQIFPLIALAQECKARIFVYTDSEKARLFVNNEFIGEGNNFELELEPGEYKISIADDFWKWNATSIKDTLRIKDCNSQIFSYTLKNKIVLDSNPTNVYVIDSDSLIGFTPMLLEEGFPNLKLHKPGYEDKLISYQEITTGVKPELEFTGELKGQSFYDSFLSKFLIGTAIALGATTAYYKLEADKKFDEYQITGDPELLEQTDKYDLISGITFVALQINFGLILYFFLTD